MASRVGQVLVTTHQYVKAIEYYSTAVQKDETQKLLRIELAELYLELQKYDQAQKELQMLLGDEASAERDLDEVCLQVKALMLLSRVLKEQGMTQEAIETLMKARGSQANVLSRVRVEAADQLAAQREVTRRHF